MNLTSNSARTVNTLKRTVLLSVLCGIVGALTLLLALEWLPSQFQLIAFALSFVALLTAILSIMLFVARDVKNGHPMLWPGLLLLGVPLLAGGFTGMLLGRGLIGAMSLPAALVGFLSLGLFLVQHVKNEQAKQPASPLILLLLIPCLAGGLAGWLCTLGAGFSGGGVNPLPFAFIGYANTILLVVIVLTFVVSIIAKLKS